MLGTGNAGVTKCFNTCFVVTDDNGEHLLVDGGGGNLLLTQLKNVQINLDDISHIFVTHKHIDHILGVLWVIRLKYQRAEREGIGAAFNIYAHDEVIEYLEYMARHLILADPNASLEGKLNFVTVHDGEKLEINGHEMTFFDIRSTKAKQYGFVMEYAEGQKLMCCGDEPCREWEYKYADGIKWMMHEAFCLGAMADKFKPGKKSHSSLKEACETAEFLKVPNLIIYHTEEETLERRKELYTEEGRSFYSGNLFVPDDLEVIEL